MQEKTANRVSQGSLTLSPPHPPRTEVEITDNITLFGSINNIFDRQYKSFGVYGDAAEVLGNEFDNGQFVSPGAPRAGWVGIRLTL